MEITKDQALFILGVTQRTIYRMIERGELPEPITTEALDEWIDKTLAQASQEHKARRSRLTMVRMDGAS